MKNIIIEQIISTVKANAKAAKKPAAKPSSMAEKVQDLFSKSEGQLFGCQTAAVAKLVSVMIGHEINPGKEAPKFESLVAVVADPAAWQGSSCPGRGDGEVGITLGTTGKIWFPSTPADYWTAPTAKSVRPATVAETKQLVKSIKAQDANLWNLIKTSFTLDQIGLL